MDLSAAIEIDISSRLGVLERDANLLLESAFDHSSHTRVTLQHKILTSLGGLQQCIWWNFEFSFSSLVSDYLNGRILAVRQSCTSFVFCGNSLSTSPGTARGLDVWQGSRVGFPFDTSSCSCSYFGQGVRRDKNQPALKFSNYIMDLKYHQKTSSLNAHSTHVRVTEVFVCEYKNTSTRFFLSNPCSKRPETQSLSIELSCPRHQLLPHLLNLSSVARAKKKKKRCAMKKKHLNEHKIPDSIIVRAREV